MDASTSNAQILASAVRAADTTSDTLDNPSNKGVIVWVNLTVQAGAETVTPVIQIKDPVSGNWVNYCSFAAIAATGNVANILYPGALDADGTATVTDTKSLPLPRTWRVFLDHSSTGNHTYSVGYSYLV